jgi:hypothetical protein
MRSSDSSSAASFALRPSKSEALLLRMSSMRFLTIRFSISLVEFASQWQRWARFWSPLMALVSYDIFYTQIRKIRHLQIPALVVP